MPALLCVFLAASLAWEGVSLSLLRRQITHVARHRDAVPRDFADQVSLEDHRKAADYTVASARFACVHSLFDLAVTVAWVLGGLDFLAGALGEIVPPSPLQDVLLVGAMMAMGFALDLPFSAYHDLSLEQRFGFNKTTLRMFAADALKKLAIAAVVGAPLLFGLFWVMRGGFGLWWLYAWLAVVVVMLAAPTIYTRFIAPLFNTFEPLRDESLRERIEGLLDRCGFRSSGLFSMDASKRSTHGNAYFIGFGRTKRIVLFDTLLKTQAPENVEAVIAHELGHFKFRHTLFGMLRGIAVMFVVFATVGWLCGQPWLLPEFGFAHGGSAMAFLAASLLLSLAGPLTAPIGNWISRRHEFQADDFSRRMVGADPMVAALTKLSRDNAATLTPDPLYALVHYSHPPVPVRVAHLRAPQAA